MTGYLTRLVRSLAAYQLADVVSKFIAVLLLPVYTRYVSPSGYGVVELLANLVIFVSIVVRFGIIEAFIRYYYTDEDPARRNALVRRAAGFLLIATVTMPGGLVRHYQHERDHTPDPDRRRDAERVLEDLRSLCRAAQAHDEHDGRRHRHQHVAQRRDRVLAQSLVHPQQAVGELEVGERPQAEHRDQERGNVTIPEDEP